MSSHRAIPACTVPRAPNTTGTTWVRHCHMRLTSTRRSPYLANFSACFLPTLPSAGQLVDLTRFQTLDGLYQVFPTFTISISISISNQKIVVIDMAQMSHVYLPSECSKNNFELLEREPCLLHIRGTSKTCTFLPCMVRSFLVRRSLGVFGTAPCSKISSYAPDQ